MDIYSKTEEFKKEIHPLVQEVLLRCDHHKIPTFMTFATENTEDKGTHYESEMLSIEAEGRSLQDDQIAKHALVMNGFEVVPAKTKPVISELEALSIEK